MKLFSSKKRAGTVAAVAALTLIGGGVAYGYWTTGGSGSGTASTGTTSDNLVVAASGPSGLVPGGTAQALTVTVTNPGANAYSVQLQNMSVAIDAGSIACDATTVPDAWFTLAGTTTVGSDTLVASGGTANLTGMTLKMNDVNIDQNVCRDADVTFDLTIS